MKVKKSKQVHHGDSLYYDERGQMFKEVGNTRVYLSGKTRKEIEARKRKK